MESLSIDVNWHYPERGGETIKINMGTFPGKSKMEKQPHAWSSVQSLMLCMMGLWISPVSSFTQSA